MIFVFNVCDDDGDGGGISDVQICSALNVEVFPSYLLLFSLDCKALLVDGCSWD